ncbi:MAG: hypothetical protein A3G51_00005 [Candidatus Yanofskybacteria bacterium RIFCSPLOWO2_12_FULL_43_11b]|uniref:Uncharacterized protein n=1 Tax=Candidatus Yanofskybacteria bacterium RIFCSPLOWO2_12_FULL_43_11b TaxID=1802710 RepID=A0A1F8H9K1_9BACT|nr:MAG: hypothetical protein A2742_02660 [Candidatus Yanofskybacteria bacterium RIFCSPHIGHO2_01_FULL_43_32]OGN11087.1 MAG: hypothetical protein A3C69_00155 [Candidatus Yanofskybacteria bacterium RIFCSPHIGHO2_02_FULL_43_12]OGN17192.1 MAG: hypothetical protein A3E34_00270 [Candidatus Yanofskybacteria bacterium RIFCSPHIGHO2_12_FULL_43_11]OGN24982.1 MAG: hypothetical protein A2923_03365 [Candidatus Yanofskybacteria bacterium RIFCSPLOWO2_01_FULL_43_46]OGN34243.1 MAG: hypothetical protein A3G51_00005
MAHPPPPVGGWRRRVFDNILITCYHRTIFNNSKKEIEMKNIIVVLLVGSLAFNAVACSAPTKTINGTTYSDYGLFNLDDKNPNIKYEPNWWNVAMGVIFFEMIIPPIYVFGFHLFEPVGPKSATPGAVSQ